MIRTVPVTAFLCSCTFTTETKNHGQQVVINIIICRNLF